MYVKLAKRSKIYLICAVFIYHNQQTLGVLNVDLILVGLEIWSKQDKIKLAVDMDEAIDHLADFRKAKLIPRRWNDAVVLIT